MKFATKAWPAQERLTELLKTRTQLSGWERQFGLPPALTEDRYIWVDEGIDEWEQEEYTTGLESKTEQFQLVVYFYDRKTGATAAEIRTEVQQAADQLADIIGSNSFLDGILMRATISKLVYDGSFADGEGRSREGVLKVTISCSAFLA